MKIYKTEQIRNIATGAHGAAGKTSIVEAMMFNMGVSNRIGQIESGNTLSDYNEDEIERQISINASLLHGDVNNHKLNIIDTPGYPDFFGEVVSSYTVVDSVMIVVSAVGGVEVGTELVWQEANKRNLPRFFVINKLDRENIDFESTFESLVESFGHKVVLAQFPVQTGPGFHSIVDLIRMKLITFQTDGSGKSTESDIPSDLAEKATELQLKLIEAVAESDDSLMEKYFENESLSEDEFRGGLRKAILNHEVYPVVCVSGTTNVGVKRLNDIIANFMPAPNDGEGEKTEDGELIAHDENAPISARIFKTVSEAHVGELSYFKVISGTLEPGKDVFNTTQDKGERIGQMFWLNGKNKESVEKMVAGDIGAVVKLKATHTGDTLCEKNKQFKFPEIDFPDPSIRSAIIPKAKGDEEKIGVGLHALHEEDPTFNSTFDPELHQTIISGQGELHLTVILARLKQKYHVEVEEEEPNIPYRETIKKSAEAQGKYKKQSGGRGQYGDCHLRLEPMPRGADFEFVNAIVGGVIPGKFIPAIEKGIIERMERGVIAGNRVVDVKVTVFDGSYHNVDSSEMAFKVAGSMGFQKAFDMCNPVLLEPIYDVIVRVPEEFMGDVMGDVSSRRGKIMGMDTEGKFQVINARIPLAELFKYSTTLRSMTSGRGIHKRKFSHYEEVPPDFAKKIIDAYNKSKEEEE